MASLESPISAHQHAQGPKTLRPIRGSPHGVGADLWGEGWLTLIVPCVTIVLLPYFRGIDTLFSFS